MTIESFAEAHHLPTGRDVCRELIIPGRDAYIGAGPMKRLTGKSHIYEHGDGRYGVLLFFDTKRQWSAAKRKVQATGFTIRQDGDTEGTALFDPADRKQARLAIKLAGVRARRQLTPEQREALILRFKRPVECQFAA